MTPRMRAWLLVLGVFVGCCLMVSGAFWYRSRNLSPAAMLKRMPASESIILYIDMAQLRRLGITDRLFNNSKVGQDPEYQSFIQQIDFDFRNDLDAAMLAISPAGKYLLARGRFDWSAFTSYVTGSGGRCNNAVCNLVGSAPDRHISFFPLQKGILALAVSNQDDASDRLNSVDQRPDLELPNAPIWLMIPPSILHSNDMLPTGTRMFAEKLDRAQMVLLSVNAQNNRYSVRMEVRCPSIGDAVTIASDLTAVTNLLRRLIESENQKPNPADLSGFLTAGTFHNEGAKVIGDWPIIPALMENLFGP